MLPRALAPTLLLASTIAWGASTSSSAPAVSPEALARDPRVVQALRLLEAWADTETVDKRLPGVSMAVVHDQQLLWSRGFGYAHLESKVAARADTMYSIRHDVLDLLDLEAVHERRRDAAARRRQARSRRPGSQAFAVVSHQGG